MSDWPSNNQVDALWKRVQKLDAQAEIHPTEVRLQYDELLKEVRQCGDRELLIRTLHLFGKVTYLALDYETTLRYNSEALDIALLDNKIEWAFRAQNALGITRVDQQLHREALEEFSAASRLAKQLDNILGYAKVLTNIVVCHLGLQNIDEAYKIQTEALEILNDKESREKMRPINESEPVHILCLGQLNMMTIQNKRMKPQLVIELASSTLALAREIRHIDWEVYARCEYSRALRAEGQIQKAYSVMQNMLDYSESVKQADYRAETQLEMAYIMRDLGDLSRMHEYLEKILVYSQDMGLIEIESRVHAVYAQYFEQKGNYKLALKHNRLQSELEKQKAKNIFDAHARSLVNYAQLRSLQRDLALERRKNQQLDQKNNECLELQEKLIQRVKYDKLTGLKDRKHFMQAVQAILVDSQAQEHAAFFLLEIDCPHIVSELQSYALRDQILQEVSQRLSEFIREPNLIGRLGNNEFGILIERVESRSSAEAIAYELLEKIEAPYIFENRQVKIHAVVGCVLAPDDGDQAELLEIHADMVLSETKKNRTQVGIYQPQIKKAHEHHLFMANQLQEALQRGEFELCYQGRFEVKQSTPHLMGLEALLRWKNPHLGEILPDTFLPLAEQVGLLEPLGQWIIEEICQRIKQWGLEEKELHVSCNFGAIQLQPQFFDQIQKRLEEYQISPSTLVIEIDTSFVPQILAQQELRKSLNALQTLGCQVLLDRFGVEDIHLISLDQWPLRYLSLDEDLTKEILKQTQILPELFKGLFKITECLDIKVIAKGVEQADQVHYLQTLGLDLFQGSYLQTSTQDLDKLLK